MDRVISSKKFASRRFSEPPRRTSFPKIWAAASDGWFAFSLI